MESPTGLSQAPAKHYLATFQYGISYLYCLPIFSSLEPSKSPPTDKESFMRSLLKGYFSVSIRIPSFGDSPILTPHHTRTP